MWSVVSANVVGLNSMVCIVKSAGVCTFGMQSLVERVKIAFGESAPKGLEVIVVRIVLGDKKSLVCIHNKAYGKNVKPVTGYILG